ncbi:hypothetical protein BKA80DRAFT_36871 [Phyllosticta citrichinensis]
MGRGPWLLARSSFARVVSCVSVPESLFCHGRRVTVAAVWLRDGRAGQNNKQAVSHAVAAATQVSAQFEAAFRCGALFFLLL